MIQYHLATVETGFLIGFPQTVRDGIEEKIVYRAVGLGPENSPETTFPNYAAADHMLNKICRSHGKNLRENGWTIYAKSISPAGAVPIRLPDSFPHEIPQAA